MSCAGFMRLFGVFQACPACGLNTTVRSAWPNSVALSFGHLGDDTVGCLDRPLLVELEWLESSTGAHCRSRFRRDGGGEGLIPVRPRDALVLGGCAVRRLPSADEVADVLGVVRSSPLHIPEGELGSCRSGLAPRAARCQKCECAEAGCPSEEAAPSQR